MSKPPSFQDQVAKALKGDGAARDWLSREYESFVYRCAHNKLYAHLRPVVGSLDICGDVWKSFWEAADNGQFLTQEVRKGSTEPDAFLLDSPVELEKLLQSMVYHKVIRAFRKEAAKGRTPPGGKVDVLEGEPPASGPTPSVDAGNKELAEKAWALLSEEEKRILEWRIEEKFSFVDIAAQLGKKPDAVRKQYNSILDRLRTELSPADHE